MGRGRRLHFLLVFPFGGRKLKSMLIRKRNRLLQSGFIFLYQIIFILSVQRIIKESVFGGWKYLHQNSALPVYRRRKEEGKEEKERTKYVLLKSTDDDDRVCVSETIKFCGEPHLRRFQTDRCAFSSAARGGFER